MSRYKIVVAGEPVAQFMIESDGMPDIIRFPDGSMLIYDHSSAWTEEDERITAAIFARPMIHEEKLLPEFEVDTMPLQYIDKTKDYVRLDISTYDLQRFLFKCQAIVKTPNTLGNVWWTPDGEVIALRLDGLIYIRDDRIDDEIREMAGMDAQRRQQWHDDRYPELRIGIRTSSTTHLKTRRRHMQARIDGAEANHEVPLWMCRAAIAWINAELARRIPHPDPLTGQHPLD